MNADDIIVSYPTWSHRADMVVTSQTRMKNTALCVTHRPYPNSTLVHQYISTLVHQYRRLFRYCDCDSCGSLKINS